MKRSVTIQLITSLLILLFAYTAINKLMDYSTFKVTLGRSPLIGGYASMLASVIPIVELIITALLFFPVTRMAGLYSSLVLMILFTGYIGYMLAFASKLPCSCGGVLQQMTWHQHLYFNIFFVLLSLAGILLEKRRRKREEYEQQAPVVFT